MEESQIEQTGQGNNLLASIPERMFKVVSNPVQFYSKDMPKSGGFLEPLVFMVVMAAISALVMAVAGMVGLGPVGMMAMGLAGVIMLPVMVAIFGFIGAAILFVIWKVMGSGENYETAYRCAAFGFAYAPVAALVSGIPYLGTLVSSLWPMALMAIASIHVHGRSANVSWVVFGILGCLQAFMGVGAEHTSRQMVGGIEGWAEQMEEKYGDPDEMTPEQAGEMLGEFLKGIEKGSEK